MNGFLVLDAKRGIILYSQKYCDNFGLSQGSKQSNPEQGTSDVEDLGVTAGILFALYLNSCNLLDQGDDDLDSETSSGLTLFSIGTTTLHFRRHQNLPVLLICSTNHRFSERKGVQISDSLLYSFVKKFENQLHRSVRFKGFSSVANNLYASLPQELAVSFAAKLQLQGFDRLSWIYVLHSELFVQDMDHPCSSASRLLLAPESSGPGRPKPPTKRPSPASRLVSLSPARRRWWTFKAKRPGHLALLGTCQFFLNSDLRSDSFTGSVSIEHLVSTIHAAGRLMAATQSPQQPESLRSLQMILTPSPSTSKRPRLPPVSNSRPASFSDQTPRGDTQRSLSVVGPSGTKSLQVLAARPPLPPSSLTVPAEPPPRSRTAFAPAQQLVVLRQSNLLVAFSIPLARRSPYNSLSTTSHTLPRPAQPNLSFRSIGNNQSFVHPHALSELLLALQPELDLLRVVFDFLSTRNIRLPDVLADT